MALAPELSKGIELIDHELLDIEKSLNVLMQHSNQNGEEAMKEFIFSVRTFSRSQSVMTAAFTRAIKRISIGENDIIRRENKVLQVIRDIRGKVKFSPKELADLLESSFDAFIEHLAFAVRLHPGEKPKLMGQALCSRREKLMQELKRSVDMQEFGQLVEVGSLNRLRDVVNKLATVRYRDLSKYLYSLDAIIGDFNRMYNNIYEATETLSFIKGVDLQPKKTFFGFVINKETKPMPLGLTQDDLRRIKAIQGAVHDLHERGMKLIRGKQREILAEIGQIKNDETELRAILKKVFRGAEQKIPLKMAA